MYDEEIESKGESIVFITEETAEEREDSSKGNGEGYKKSTFNKDLTEGVIKNQDDEIKLLKVKVKMLEEALKEKTKFSFRFNQ